MANIGHICSAFETGYRNSNHDKKEQERWDSQTWLDDIGQLERFGYLRSVEQPHAG